MLQAIVTKHIGPTNSKPARISVKAAAGRIMVPWNHGLSNEGNHTCAAMQLAVKLGWTGVYHGGGTPDANGFVYVCETGDIRDKFTLK
ncbi:hypothetical protein M2323_004688 [Rhodoblastus acidophilus]|nr:hypothetical protein [Rhodoblastus acidophilus]MCW2335732.1 hypothetical protein [Rhodoblastus acidophilus]